MVLNQLLYEVPLLQIPVSIQCQQFLDQIRAFYFLDSGKIGGSGAWVTDAPVLQVAVTRIPRFCVYLTPYQMEDKSRSWIKKEEKKFVNLLRTYGSDIKEYFLFKGKLPSLEDHFAILKMFRQPWSTC